LIRIRLYQGVAAQQAGDHAQALALLESVTESYKTLLGPRHTRTLLSSLQQVRSLVALGRRGQALSLIDRAFPILQESLGTSSPLYQQLVALRAEVVTNKPSPINSAASGLFM
jgi:hypothetical protein